MKHSFTTWFEYDFAANQKLLTTMSEHESQLPEQAMQLMSHITTAHDIWNHRILKTRGSIEVWQTQTTAQLLTNMTRNFHQSLNIIATMELSDTIEYKNLKGEPFKSTLKDILFHLLTHSMYHRGQIATRLRAAGINPPDTNYITYSRKLTL